LHLGRHDLRPADDPADYRRADLLLEAAEALALTQLSGELDLLPEPHLLRLRQPRQADPIQCEPQPHPPVLGLEHLHAHQAGPPFTVHGAARSLAAAHPLNVFVLLRLHARLARVDLQLAADRPRVANAEGDRRARKTDFGAQHREARHADADAVAARDAPPALGVGVLGHGVFRFEAEQPAGGVEAGAEAHVAAVLQALLFGELRPQAPPQ